ncbi:MAG: phytanoyl-CoA dioxygenase family protein [Parvularculaceae bacterium]|nr:phytanoyl-CoA dioxygenase family protein [Parvularculaceae bacterium]
MSQTTGRIPLPSMTPLEETNDLIGDAAGLQARLDNEAYAFFRNVLDADAVQSLKKKYMKVLVDMGYVDEGQTDPIWNGKDLTDFPIKIEPLHDDRVWEAFVAHPAVNDFFKGLLGGAPFWLPIVEYRITPPTKELPDDPLWPRHQDGFYNGDLNCYTCWVPLMDIGEAEGGIAMATGMHKDGYLHDLNDPPQYWIPQGAIPPEVWKRSDYHPGDMVMFTHWIPHSGLPNRSDRFRMSMDVRVMRADADLPVLGIVKSFTPDAIVVANHDGREVRLAVNEDTYCRWTAGRRIPIKELIAKIPAGDRVLAFHKDGRATMLRPPR